MRKIKTIDDITKDGKVEFGEGYEFVSTAEEADAILMRSTDLHGYELPEGIRAIARCGAGVNNIPVEEYAKKGVVVFNSPGANSNAVKELVLGMLVLSSRGVVQSMNWVRDNADDPEIQVDAEKAKKAFVGRELKGKRIGVIGLGNVGSKVANACVNLGMDVYGYDPFISVEHAWVLSREVQRVGTLEDLCRGCDYLTVHVPSKADTIGMISTEQINLLAPDAVLINYARETIIDEDAVDAALREGKLSWFSCDFATPKTVKMPNTFITTHSGAGTGEAEANCADMAISELKDYLENGNLQHGQGARRKPHRLPARQRAQHDRSDHGNPGQGQCQRAAYDQRVCRRERLHHVRHRRAPGQQHHRGAQADSVDVSRARDQIAPADLTGSSPCGLPVTDIECPRGRLSHERRPRFCERSIKCTEPLLDIQFVC